MDFGPQLSKEEWEAMKKMSNKDQEEINHFIMNEMQKGKVQNSIHNLTEICWKKCITGRISSGKLEKNEEICTQLCVERFLDANLTILKQLENMRGQ